MNQDKAIVNKKCRSYVAAEPDTSEEGDEKQKVIPFL